MHAFCCDLGWCGSAKNGKRQHVSDFIPKTGQVTAEQFARWLITAEGFDPNHLRTSELKQLTSVFIKHMGADVVYASALRSEYPGA